MKNSAMAFDNKSRPNIKKIEMFLSKCIRYIDSIEEYSDYFIKLLFVYATSISQMPVFMYKTSKSQELK